MKTLQLRKQMLIHEKDNFFRITRGVKTGIGIWNQFFLNWMYDQAALFYAGGGLPTFYSGRIITSG